MGLSLGLRPKISLKIDLPFDISGDLELLSLHRIKNKIPSMRVHEYVRKRLISELISENSEYREIHNNKRLCITPTGLDNSVDKTYNHLKEQVDISIEPISLDQVRLAERLRDKLYGKVEDQTKVIKDWFSNNYDELIYDTHSRIPYPIVMKMRERFGRWAMGSTNSFNEPIEDLIEETARTNGINPVEYASPEELWKKLKEIKK